jgi:hypothetical protein
MVFICIPASNFDPQQTNPHGICMLKEELNAMMQETASIYILQYARSSQSEADGIIRTAMATQPAA